MFPAARRQKIVELVQQHGAVSLRQLAEAAGASEVTVRRDLQQLNDEGLVRRSRGGAIAVAGARERGSGAAGTPPRGDEHPTEVDEPSYADKSRVARAEKEAIAERAAELIRPGDAVVIGAGTTTEALARRLAQHTALTVVTNSIVVAQALAASAGIEVTLTGGSLQGSTFALIGPAAEASLSHLHAPRLFISGNGLTASRGLSTPRPEVASMDRALVAAAREVVVLADHTKVGHDELVLTVPAESIRYLVTDPAADSEVLTALRARGVEVLVASTSD